jgi:hypothetical protein
MSMGKAKRLLILSAVWTLLLPQPNTLMSIKDKFTTSAAPDAVKNLWKRLDN